MSISRNVGALARYLTRITTQKIYLQFEADVWELLGKVPRYGLRARKVARRMKESIKNLLVPTILFEELGFRYFGPLDGHDLPQLISAFSQIREVPGPVIVHLMTKKGKGYTFAEQDAEKFHGIGSFYKATGASKSNGTKPTYSEVFGAALVELARRDPRVVAVTAAMKEGTGLAPFAAEFPERFFDVGIAEQHAVTFAAGLARSGLKPFVAVYSTFLQRGFDQIIHDVALQRLGVRFVLDRAGLVGEDGPTHHGAFDLSYLRLVPGMVVMAPRDDGELRSMMLAMLEHDAGPIAIRFPRGTAVVAPRRSPEVAAPIGRGETLRRGADAALVCIGSMVEVARSAADLLANAGISVSLIDAKFVKPLDAELLLSAAGESRIVFALEESARAGGFGDAILEFFSERAPGTRVVTIGLPDRFVPHGKREDLLAEVGLSPETVAAEVSRFIGPGAGARHGGNR